MNGNVTKVGITADLEAMKRVGIGAATIISAGQVGDVPPPGHVKFLGEEWLEMVRFALSEGSRLGIQIGFENCAGWSESGGPWVTPEHSMLEVVYREVHVNGPTHFANTLPTPEARAGFYRDVAVLAFPTPAVETLRLADRKPTITCSVPGVDAAAVISESGAGVTFPVADEGKPAFIQLGFAQPYEADAVLVTPDTEVSGSGEIEVSDEGRNWRKVGSFNLRRRGSTQAMAFPAASARFYRLVFSGLHTENKAACTIKHLDLIAGPRLNNFGVKADNYPRGEADEYTAQPVPESPPSTVLQPDAMLDLTSRVDASGRLVWDAPAGDWTVFRFGYTTTGETNHPAPDGGLGLECDKMSREAVKAYWDGLFPKILAVGSLVGKPFDHTLIDSYEAGAQNWTPAFPEQFKQRRGYDLLPYLPVLTGRVVGSAERSERFLWDFRRTVADLFAENYYDYFADLAHQAGLKLEVEPYGDGPFDNLLVARNADRVMGEFWWRNYRMDQRDTASETLIIASSTAHTYGKRIVGAESFTSEDGGWDMDPANLKGFGDAAFTLGINSFTFHRFIHQPWPDRHPGLTLGGYGSNLERSNTWWEQSSAWVTYLARSQFLLQQALFVADALYLGDEGAPSTLPPKGDPHSPADLPKGYAYDSCSPDVVLHRLAVRDGRLTLPDGMSYRVLVLPPGSRMTPELLEKIKELVDAGATILGTRPIASPSLSGYPGCDVEVRRLAAELWDGGKIIQDKSTAEVLAAGGVRPDFEAADEHGNLRFIHRAAAGADIYFISNQRNLYEDTECTFRTGGKIPEIWHPDTGQIERPAVYTDQAGQTRLPLRLDPSGSVFVVFRKSSAGSNHAVALTRVGTEGALNSDFRVVHADYGVFSYEFLRITAPVDVTVPLSEALRANGMRLKVTNALAGKDPAPGVTKYLKVDYVLQGRPVSEMAMEGETLDLAGVGRQTVFPEARLTSAADGGFTLEAWQGGSHVVKTATGTLLNATVPTLPPPLAVGGPWTLAFPPGLGAPPGVTLDGLISWKDHPDPGVKYFSGTATYTHTVQVPPQMLGGGRRLYLDLGDVQVIAQVKLNGKDLGILWKPPYCVEITGAATPGDNALEVAVTNLWPNRIIGDEQLPDDYPGTPQVWPQWLLEGKPSLTGRITFTTHRHWKKDDPLLEAGLIGPVTLVPSVVMDVR